MFNNYFSQQCRAITNDSSLTNNRNSGTVTWLSDFNNDSNNIIKLIRSLDAAKGHVCDGILWWKVVLERCAEQQPQMFYILFLVTV